MMANLDAILAEAHESADDLVAELACRIEGTGRRTRYSGYTDRELEQTAIMSSDARAHELIRVLLAKRTAVGADRGADTVAGFENWYGGSMTLGNRDAVQNSILETLPFFDGFPYLVTRIVPSLYHINLYPGDSSEKQLLEQARCQVKANKLEACLALAPNKGTWFTLNGAEEESDKIPRGGAIVCNKLKPCIQSQVWTPELAERSARLTAFSAETTKGGGYMLGDTTLGRRPATIDDVRKLNGRREDGAPRGLVPCPRCGDLKGTCLDLEFRERTGEWAIIDVFCRCANANLCASCGAPLAHHKLNSNMYDPRDGRIWHLPGFSGLSHRCEQADFADLYEVADLMKKENIAADLAPGHAVIVQVDPDAASPRLEVVREVVYPGAVEKAADINQLRQAFEKEFRIPFDVLPRPPCAVQPLEDSWLLFGSHEASLLNLMAAEPKFSEGHAPIPYFAVGFLGFGSHGHFYYARSDDWTQIFFRLLYGGVYETTESMAKMSKHIAAFLSEFFRFEKEIASQMRRMIAYESCFTGAYELETVNGESLVCHESLLMKPHFRKMLRPGVFERHQEDRGSNLWGH